MIRLSGWVEVYRAPHHTALAGAKGLIGALRSLFATFGVPEEISSDGGKEFVASETTAFFHKWNIRHRLSSAYFPQSNGRAEVAVKKCKRLLEDNVGPHGSLNNDNFLRAILQVRNTPDPDCNVSPAEILFGKPLRDAFSFINRLNKFENPVIRPTWREAWSAKERAMKARLTRSAESLNRGTRNLPSLVVGDRVFIQNQRGSHPTKWDASGTVMDVLENDQHIVKVDGTGRVTLRNRRFLRKFTPATVDIARSDPPPVQSETPPTPVCQQPTATIPIQDVLPPPLSTVDNPPTQDSTSAPQQGTTEVFPDVCASDDPPVETRPPPEPRRGQRDRAPAKHYVPETGTWE